MEQKNLFPKGEIIRSENFTGEAWLKMLVADADSTFDTQVYNVTFAPTVRNSWHSHPGGQILLCTAGKGFYQERGKHIQLLQVGDAVEIRPNIVHWHGATPDGEFSHIGITTQVSKGAAIWYEPVTDEEYYSFNEQSVNTSDMKQLSPKDYTTFKVSENVTLYKVTFLNQLKMKVAGHLFIPNNSDRNAQNPAIIVGHPMGAVKEQAADVYASNLADRGFITLAIDLSFWGESEGEPHNIVVPDIYAEDFSAAVDFLGTRPFVDRERIGVIGICGSGGFAISAAKIDPRLKAVATISMYDMGAACRNGLNHSFTLEQRKQMQQQAAEQRYLEFAGGKTQYTGGTVHKLDENTDPVAREFFNFYRTSRGEYTPKGSSPELTTHPTLSSMTKFHNFYPFNDIETISPRPLLFITGDKAHSREFSEDAYNRAAEPKELYIVPNAIHTDLYDKINIIPFDKLGTFFKENFKN